MKPFYDLAFGQRPVEELYDLRDDPDQMRNVAGQPAYAAAQRELSERLARVMRETKDPRLEDAFDRPPYVESNPSAVKSRKKKERGGKKKGTS